MSADRVTPPLGALAVRTSAVPFLHLVLTLSESSMSAQRLKAMRWKGLVKVSATWLSGGMC